MSDISFQNKMKLKFMGRQQIVMFFDNIQVFSRKQTQFPQQVRQCKIQAQQNFRNNLIGGGCLSLALSLSLQRYFPGAFGKFSVNKLLADLLIITGCVSMTTYAALLGNTDNILKIKRSLLMRGDQKFYSHMNILLKDFRITYREQLINVLNKEQLQIFEAQRTKMNLLT